MQNEKTYSVKVIKYTIPQDQHENFETAYNAAGKHLKASKYCLAYQVIRGSDEPDHYIVIIHWTSKEEHINGFRKSVEFMPFFNLVKPFFSNIDEMKHYDLTTNLWKRN